MTSVLQQHSREVRDQPAIRNRLEQHLEETRRHAEAMRTCLESLGETPSMVKSWAGGAMGLMEGRSTTMFRDKLVKNIVADYAMEHFEMACYSALASVAEEVGLVEIARVCREIFGEEAEMADWLEEHVPDVARAHVHATAGS